MLYTFLFVLVPP